MSELYLNGVTVNSTANARRIADVEQCFGSAGQPLAVPGEQRKRQSWRELLMSCVRSGAGGGGGAHQGMQKEAKTPAVLPVQ